MEEIKMFSGWFHYQKNGLSTAEANQAAIEEANKWMENNKNIKIMHRATHISADFLAIIIWRK
ncbi:hypothetical protein ACFLZ0_02595 [Patescibacteria group bacterium]